MIFLLLGLMTRADTLVTYRYCLDDYKFTVQAYDEGEAMKKAGRLCFMALTRGKYPGEEEGMKIIDKCANLKRCK